MKKNLNISFGIRIHENKNYMDYTCSSLVFPISENTLINCILYTMMKFDSDLKKESLKQYCGIYAWIDVRNNVVIIFKLSHGHNPIVHLHIQQCCTAKR